MNKKNFITLKEAAQKSGYSPDYIGQLIRSGKLPGKQMYSGVAWVTSEEALSRYLLDAEKTRKPRSSKLFGQNSLVDGGLIKGISKFIFYAVIFIGGIIIIALFYVLSLKLERALEIRGIQQAESLRK